MPIYTFEDTKTGKVFDDMMSMDELDKYLKKKNTDKPENPLNQVYLINV